MQRSPLMSIGRTQCLMPLAAYPPSSITGGAEWAAGCLVGEQWVATAAWK